MEFDTKKIPIKKEVIEQYFGMEVAIRWGQNHIFGRLYELKINEDDEVTAVKVQMNPHESDYLGIHPNMELEVTAEAKNLFDIGIDSILRKDFKIASTMFSKNKTKVWKILSQEEKIKYRNWARINYKPHSSINGLWHPVIQLECVLMNIMHTIETK